jgi:branched-chain amino acid transport system permease protein
VGLVFDVIFGRRFFNAPRLVLTVLTIATAGFIAAEGQAGIQRLPIFPAPDSALRLRPFTIEALHAKLPFSRFHFTLGSLELRFGFVEIFAIVVSVLALVLLAAFFRYTRTGVAVRAMADNIERTALVGVSVGVLSSVVWSLAGALAGAGVTLNALVLGPGVATGFAPVALLPALAAAVLGRMERIAVTAAAAVGISVLTQAALWSFRDDAGLVDAALFVLIGAALLVQRRRRAARADETVSVSWRATEEQRPVPAQMLEIPSLRMARRALIAAGVIAAMLYPFVVSTGAANLGGVIAIDTMVAVSLVVLTGWAGQVSLGQYAFVAIGTVVAGSLSGRAGLTFWLAVPVATVVSAGVAALVGAPALRLRGLYLGVATLALAVAAHSVLFNARYFGWMLPDAVSRPRLLGLDFSDERSMYYLTVFALALVLVCVYNLRRSRFGRLLIGLRDNEANVQSLGVSVLRMKLIAFAVSGGIAGFAGAIFAHQQRGISEGSFGAEASIGVFLLAVVGGVGSVGGALLGAMYFNVTRYFVTNAEVQGIIGAGGTLYLLFAAPGGLISIATRLRDGVLRIVAQRRQMIVPSLFADYDPEVLQRRLIPLDDPAEGTGLHALPETMRFDRESVLYGHDARHYRRDEGAEALAAAASRARDEAPGSPA